MSRSSPDAVPADQAALAAQFDASGTARRDTVRIPPELDAGIEQLVKEDAFESRSALYRAAIRQLLVSYDG
ncbi:ribbon-helix-helix domain-containing protein [Halobaculum gomorrense]|uniref:Ribbon-helix-helix protein, copG family n=1 Tax=Halobaculum gomorrense TaxID=43928 RepID=A0A1M5UTA6_9EURY|nr:ribbon-helix-helix domain-containing protein [Halobaculum gomorrense]SHH65953.1 Ribbon-helix-helix protein, copG family [Halobaculum gomorrense]